MKITEGVTRWLGRNREKSMTTFQENILSDPTSDGNVSEFNQIAPSTPPEPPSYQTFPEFDRRPINELVNSDSLTQRCPTCGGTGKLTKEQEHDLVALIPVRDRRLKPRRTVLYLLLAIFFCLAIATVVGVLFFPRNITIHLESAAPVNVSIPRSNSSDPFIIINSTISIHNSNFFEAHVDNFNIEVNWEDYVVANPDIPGGVRVKPRSTLNHTFYVTTTYSNQEADKIRRVCCGWSFNLAFLITVSAKTHSLTTSSEASDYRFKYINCQLQGMEWWKTCFNDY